MRIHTAVEYGIANSSNNTATHAGINPSLQTHCFTRVLLQALLQTLTLLWTQFHSRPHFSTDDPFAFGDQFKKAIAALGPRGEAR